MRSRPRKRSTSCGRMSGSETVHGNYWCLPRIYVTCSIGVLKLLISANGNSESCHESQNLRLKPKLPVLEDPK